MDHTKLLLAAAVVLTTSASAEVFSATDNLHFSLTRGTLSSPEDADLDVTAYGVTAKYGVKRASREGEFSNKEVAVFGEPYDVKDAAGGKWRLWIKSAEGKRVQVEILRARRPATRSDRTYKAVAVTIDGTQAEPTFSQLTLLADGTYRFGKVFGRYVLDEGGVTLDGVPGYWGRAAYTLDGEGLMFRFNRGQLLFEVKYELQTRPNVADATDAPSAPVAVSSL